MTTLCLADGTVVPRLGQGTWRMGERGGHHAAEIASLRVGLDLGLTLIDTAEMYADGGAEEIVAEAIAGRREEVFLVSKAYPHNAGAKSLPLALEASLKRLKVERLSLRARTCTLKVRYADFTTITRSRSVEPAMRDREAISEVARELLLASTEAGTRPIRLLGVSLSNLESEHAPEQLWFDWHE